MVSRSHPRQDLQLALAINEDQKILFQQLHIFYLTVTFLYIILQCMQYVTSDQRWILTSFSLMKDFIIYSEVSVKDQLKNYKE